MRLKNVGVFDRKILMIFIIIFCYCIQICHTKAVKSGPPSTPTLPPTTTPPDDGGNVTSSYIDTAPSKKPTTDTTTTSSFESTTTEPIGNGALLYAIIAICATVIIVAICCGCICLIKMRYRFTSLRVNFYGQGGMFRRNGAHNGGGTVTSTHAANEYITHQYENEKFEFDKWEIPINDLLIDKTTKLGSGAFASVYKGYLKGKNPLLENSGNINFALEMAENRDNEVAIKMLHSHADDDSREELKKEIAFMKTLGYHPHVLSMIGCVSSIYEPLLIVEYCANGDLLTLLRRHKDYILVDPEADCPAQADFCLTIKDLLSFSWQISDGLVYLSSKNFIHRDIACRNVLITKRMVAKISDFGLCRYSQEALYTTKVGKLPIKWMAIEALKLAEFTSKSDVWSYGVLLFELFSVGDTPYPSISPSDMLDFLLQGNRLPRPELCPEELYNMMQIMWDVNPESRPTFEIIRRNLSAFLEVSSDAYGYIQVSQDYGKFYSKIEFPMKAAAATEGGQGEKIVAVESDADKIVIMPASVDPEVIVIQKKDKEIEEENDIEKIDNVNDPDKCQKAEEESNDVGDDSKTPLIQKEETPAASEERNSDECRPTMDELLKVYFAAKGCNSSPNSEHTKDTGFYFPNFHQQQPQHIPSFPQFNPIFQQPQQQYQQFNPMQNRMFWKRQYSPIPQHPMIPQSSQQQFPQSQQPFQLQPQQQQQQQSRFSRPPFFSNRQRFNFRPNRNENPSQNFSRFPPPRSL